MLTHKQRVEFGDWLVNNLQLTSVTNIQHIIDHVDRYFSPESPDPKGNASAEEQDEFWDDVYSDILKIDSEGPDSYAKFKRLEKSKYIITKKQ
jgi:hypothetical protein